MKSKKSKKVLLILLIIIVFIAGIFIGKVFNKSQSGLTQEITQTTQIVEVEVGMQTIENTLTSSGEILSSSTEQLELSTSKYFKTMCVEENDIVAAGENILQYSNGTYLTAEYDCLISSYSVPETGSKCTSSNYVEVQNLETMTMKLSVDEGEINKIKEGQEVSITVNAIDDKDYSGTIKSVSGIGTYQSSGTTFSAVVEFENDGNVKTGMSASCSITIEKAENVVAIPINAVQIQDNQKYVVVVNDDGSTQNVNIETGISNDSYVHVTSGLSGGEKIQMTQIVTTNSNSNGSFSRGSQSENGDKSQMRMQGGSGQMPDMSEMPDMTQMPNMGN